MNYEGLSVAEGALIRAAASTLTFSLLPLDSISYVNEIS